MLARKAMPSITLIISPVLVELPELLCIVSTARPTTPRREGGNAGVGLSTNRWPFSRQIQSSDLHQPTAQRSRQVFETKNDVLETRYTSARLTLNF
jgi:hypothetical protein